MTKRTVSGATIFQIPAANFAISPSTEGYTLNYSADGENFTAWDTATQAATTEVVCNAPIGMYFKLVGNESTVTILY